MRLAIPGLLAAGVIAAAIGSFYVTLSLMDAGGVAPASTAPPAGVAPRQAAAPTTPILPSGFAQVKVIGQQGATGWSRQSLEVKEVETGVELLDESADYGSADYTLTELKRGALTVLLELAKATPSRETVLLVRGNLGTGEEYNCAYDTRDNGTIAWGSTPPSVKVEPIPGGVRMTCRMRVQEPSDKPLIRLFPAIGPDLRTQSGATTGGLVVTRMAIAKE